MGTAVKNYWRTTRMSCNLQRSNRIEHHESVGATFPSDLRNNESHIFKIFLRNYKDFFKQNDKPRSKRRQTWIILN